MTDRELERLHLLATLRTYGPSPASFICERANDEAAHDAFDPVPEIARTEIASRLLALRDAGLASYDNSFLPGNWDITSAGGRVLDDGLAALDGWVDWVDHATVVTDAMVERGARTLLEPDVVDLTSEPPGPVREDYARAVARRLLVTALGPEGESDG